MSTMQELVDAARETLNDEDKDRYTDAQLLGHANFALRQARMRRPDMWIGQYGAAWADKALGDDFPLPDEYLPTFVDYVIGRAESKDDEHVNSGRATAFFNLFAGGLNGA